MNMTGHTKKLIILGSTGSIGRQTLEIVRAFPERFQILGLAAGRNTDLLASQISEFRPRFVYCSSADSKEKYISPDGGYRMIPLAELAATPEADMIVIAISGTEGLTPTMSAVRAGKRIVLANKESLVMAGETINREVKRNKAQILPVDSEHSAIWQCLEGKKQDIARIILTASGGPFRGYLPAQMAKVTVEQALRHPSWQMGKKVTIDSATLLNKGLEVIEAHWLFNVPFGDITVLIHPQSIVHSMVEFADGAIKAQLGYPDMRLPIQYALSYPERLPNPELPRLNWHQTRNLTFEPPDFEAFPCLGLAIEAGRKGGTYPAVLCSAGEAAVELFLSGRIRFTDIARFVEQALEQHQTTSNPTLEEITSAAAWARGAVTKSTSGEHQC